jgi:cytochrome P450
MSDSQLIGFCILLLIAGNETTTNLIGNSLNILADRPELWQRLRQDRDLVEGVIEETLRFDSPVQMLWRTTTRPVQLRGTTIPEGEKVMVAFAAANRDAAEFADPDEFNPQRDWASHVAFGYGTHYCLGSPLARVEASVALNALLDRFPRLERGESEPRRLPSLVLRGFSALPLRLERD